MAGMICHVAIITGQFHGVIEPTTPIGLRWSSIASLVVVLQHLDRHREVGGVVGPGLDAAELEPRSHAIERLALLLGEQPGQFLGVFPDFVPAA